MFCLQISDEGFLAIPAIAGATFAHYVRSRPIPDEADGTHYFDADVMDDILANRWLGFTLIHLKRY